MSIIKVAVITGGHPFDVQPFHQLFRSLPGIDAYIQHTDEFTSDSVSARDLYNVLVFYSMLKATPTDESPWYSGKAGTALERLGQAKQGIVVLHHALLAYPDWPVWDEIVGIPQRNLKSYHPNEQVKVDIVDPGHPIAKGVAAWQMIDETYVMPEAGAGSRVFLTTENPRCVRTVGWTRQYRQARVFCFQSGHGKDTYADPSFRSVLANGIHWSAGM